MPELTTLAQHEARWFGYRRHAAGASTLSPVWRSLWAHEATEFRQAWPEASAADQDAIRMFLRHESPLEPKQPTYMADPGLHRLARAGWHEMVQAVLDTGAADIQVRNAFGQTALACAGTHEVVKVLLDAGIDVDARDTHNRLAPHAWFDEGPQSAQVIRLLRTWWKHPRTQHLDHTAWARSLLTERWATLTEGAASLLLARAGLPKEGHVQLDGRSPLQWFSHQHEHPIQTPRRPLGMTANSQACFLNLGRTPPDDKVGSISSRFAIFLQAGLRSPWAEIRRTLTEQAPECQLPLMDQWVRLNAWGEEQGYTPSRRARLRSAWFQQVWPSSAGWSLMYDWRPHHAQFMATPDPLHDGLPPLAPGWSPAGLATAGDSRKAILAALITHGKRADWEALPEPRLWLGALIEHTLTQAHLAQVGRGTKNTIRMFSRTGIPLSAGTGATPPAFEWADACILSGVRPSGQTLASLGAWPQAWVGNHDPRIGPLRQRWDEWVLDHVVEMPTTPTPRRVRI